MLSWQPRGSPHLLLLPRRLCAQVLQFKGGLQEQAGEVLEPLSRILAALDQLRSTTLRPWLGRPAPR